MATKTLTIMEDVYKMLVDNKIEGESFSDELRRILSQKKKRSLRKYFGILSEKEGEDMLKDLEKLRKSQIELSKKRMFY